jgi:hypothetical protein
MVRPAYLNRILTHHIRRIHSSSLSLTLTFSIHNKLQTSLTFSILNKQLFTNKFYSKYPHLHMDTGDPWNTTSPMDQPMRLLYPSVSDDVYEPSPSPSPCFSLTHGLRCIGPHHGTSPTTTPVRLMYLSVFDNST